MRRGDRVSIGECRFGWCMIARRGSNGWVPRGSFRLLRGGFR
jgi:hypothetical protein